MTQVFLAQILTRLDATDLSNFTDSKKSRSAGRAGPLRSLVFRLSVHFHIDSDCVSWMFNVAAEGSFSFKSASAPRERRRRVQPR